MGVRVATSRSGTGPSDFGENAITDRYDLPLAATPSPGRVHDATDAKAAAVLERVRDLGRAFGVGRFARVSFGGAVVSLTTVSAVVIALVAMSLVRHEGGVSHRLASGSTRSPSIGASIGANRHVRKPLRIEGECAGPLSVARLRADFAVLQRQQTVADQSWQQPTIASAYPYEKLLGTVPGSTRLATTLTNGSRVFVTIERFLWSGEGNVLHPYDCYGHDLLVSLVAGGRAVHFEWGSAASLAGTDANVPLRSTVGSATWITLVSNPVRSVRWVFPRQNQNRTHLFPRALTVVVPVSGNVAAARVPRNQGFYPYSVEWLGARGRVIASKVYPSLNGVTGPNSVLPREAKITSGPVRDLLSANGVGGVSFGASPATVRAMFEHLYGAPDIPDETVNSCGADHVMEWGALGLFFDNGQFVGYAYPDFLDFTPRIEYADVPILATTTAVRVGEALVSVERLYGGQFHATTPKIGEGTWSLSTTAGQLKGVTQRIRASSGHGHVIVIGSIDTGLPGCPLLTFQTL
jgi:hypothetical protein